MAHRGKLRPWRYRTPIDGEVHTFYAPTMERANRYAKRWAVRMGYKRIIRLRRGR